MQGLNPVGVWGSVVSNSLILAMLQAVAPTWSECLCWPPAAIYFPASLTEWSPYVDRTGESGHDGAQYRDGSPKCTVDSGRVSPRLAFAPVPAEFIALEGRDAPARFACVLVERNGFISAAHLLRASSDKAGNQALVRMIKLTWRFEPFQPGTTISSGWQRVRINNTDAAFRTQTKA